jgi:hypothetical protein
MNCEFCDNEFSNKQNLNAHKKRAKYCLKIQGVTNIKKFLCENCDKNFTKKFSYDRHTKMCKKTNLLVDFEKKLEALNIEIIELKKENEMLRSQLNKTEENYKDLAITAVKRPTTSNKNIQINNYIKNMPPLLESDITDNIPMLTLEHHSKGAEGYAQYAMEFPFKDKIVTIDVSRNKIKYKNEEGDIIEDVGFKKMMTKLCIALKDRSFNLSQEHYDKLSEKFSDEEMDEFDFMGAAIAITKYANGKDSDFCKDIIKMIGKGSIV